MGDQPVEYLAPGPGYQRGRGKASAADLGKTHLQVLFSALAITRSPLSELTVHGSGEDDLRYKAFDIPATHGNLAVFSSLTVLNLTFVHGFYEDPEVLATTNINPEGISFVARMPPTAETCYICILVGRTRVTLITSRYLRLIWLGDNNRTWMMVGTNTATTHRIQGGTVVDIDLWCDMLLLA